MICPSPREYRLSGATSGTLAPRLGDAGFVHAIVKIGAGRGEAARQATSTGLFDVMKAHFARQFLEQGLALSLELSEFAEAGTLTADRKLAHQYLAQGALFLAVGVDTTLLVKAAKELAAEFTGASRGGTGDGVY